MQKQRLQLREAAEFRRNRPGKGIVTQIQLLQFGEAAEFGRDTPGK